MRYIGSLKFLPGGIVLTLFLLLNLAPAGASSANLSHSYSTTGQIAAGSLVSISGSKSTTVVKANSTNGKNLIGVVVNADDSLLAVDASQGKVQVATSGVASTLVSTLNGPIKAGDQVAVSPFSGIGMKNDGQSYVVGLAQTAFNSSTSGATSQTVTDKSGKQTNISIGYVRLNIAVGAGNTTNGGGPQLNGLQKITKSLTGHVVPTIRVIISLVIAIVALAAIITLVYASIYGGIISIGRNPLAKFAVLRTVSTVMGMVLVIAIISGSLIFMLLH